jgi:hypothetical protein
MMKDAVKFGTICFGLQLILLATVDDLFPDFYPGEAFMIIFIYWANFLIAMIVYPGLFFFFRHLNLSKIGFLSVCFLLMFLIINLTSLVLVGKLYTVYLLKGMADPLRTSLPYKLELLYPLVSFTLTVLIMKSFKLSKTYET